MTKANTIKAIKEYLDAEEEEIGFDSLYDTDTDKGYMGSLLANALHHLSKK